MKHVLFGDFYTIVSYLVLFSSTTIFYKYFKLLKEIRNQKENKHTRIEPLSLGIYNTWYHLAIVNVAIIYPYHGERLNTT